MILSVCARTVIFIMCGSLFSHTYVYTCIQMFVRVKFQCL